MPEREIDIPDLFLNPAATELQILWLDQGSLAPGESRYRALYRPSFAPPLAIDLRVRDGAGFVSVALPAEARRAAAGCGDSRNPLEFLVPDEALAAWEAERGDDPLTLGDEPRRLMLDGISLLGEAREGTIYHRFQAHSPDEGTPWHRYFSAMRRLAMRSIPDGPCADYARWLGKHLDCGPLEDLGGSPRWLRLTRLPLAGASLAAVHAQIERLDPEEPWLLDLRDFPLEIFDSPSSLPVLRELARHRGPLAVRWPEERGWLSSALLAPLALRLVRRSGLRLVFSRG